VTPYERVLAALKHGGFLAGGKPSCPNCPPNKHGGFDVTEVKTQDGRPTVLLKCFRGCDIEQIIGALGLEMADLYDGSGQQQVLFDGERYCRVTTQGWKALPRGVARTFGIASSIGFFSSPRSAYTLLRTTAQWDAVRAEAGIGDRTLRKEVEIWVDRKMAHRCYASLVLALYRGPLDRCPNCGRKTDEKRFARVGFKASKASRTQNPFPITRKYAENGTERAALSRDSDTTQQTELEGPRSGTRRAAFERGRRERGRGRSLLVACEKGRRVGSGLPPVPRMPEGLPQAVRCREEARRRCGGVGIAVTR
jgi:hypothetical protein